MTDKRLTLTDDERHKCDQLVAAAFTGIHEYLRTIRGAHLFGASAHIRHAQPGILPHYLQVVTDGATFRVSVLPD